MKKLKIIMGLILVSLTFSTMANFAPAFMHTDQAEAGHVFVSSDRGLETANGISRKFNPDAPIWPYVDTVSKALKIDNSKPVSRIDSKRIDEKLADLPQYKQAVYSYYKANYWDTLSLDIMSSQKIAMELYDTGVNQGVITAAMYLQKSLNLLNANETKYKDLSVDGDIGSNTFRAYNSYMELNSKRYGKVFTEDSLLKCLNGFQFIRYHNIAIADPSQEINFLGWLKRI